MQMLRIAGNVQKNPLSREWVFIEPSSSTYCVAVGKGWINPVFTLPPVGGASFIKQVESGNGQADGDGKS